MFRSIPIRQSDTAYYKIPRVGAGFDLFKEPLTTNDLRKGLREFIRKNKALPDFFASLEQESCAIHKDVHAVVDAINKGDASAKVFEHADCDKYILYAVENEFVSFWSGMSAYTYVTALAQFTTKRDLKLCDNDVKSVRNLSVLPMFENGQMTVAGCDFFDNLHDFLLRSGANVDWNSLRKAFENLDPFEQQLIQIDMHDVIKGDSDYEINRLLYTLSYNIPFCRTSDNKYVIIPSYGVFNILLHQFENSPLQIKPVFGRVSEKTRDKLHGWDQHPVSLYSHSVRSNLDVVHELRAGPIPNWLHDMGHVLWGTMLGYQNRRFLNKEFLPYLRRRNEGGDKVLKRFVSVLIDYDLSPTTKFLDKDIRFKSVMQRWAEKLYRSDQKLCNDAFIETLLPVIDEWLQCNAKHSNFQDVAGLKSEILTLVNEQLKLHEQQRLDVPDEASPPANLSL